MEKTNTEIQEIEKGEMDIFTTSLKLKAMMEFVKENLIKDTDYMSIAGGKPTLMKSGAEKMNILMGYSAEYEKTHEIMNPKDSYYHVEIKCTLRNKLGRRVADCLASCNNKEQAKVKEAETRGIDMYSQLNSILKIAEKRAYVGATLNANALSHFYTQDLEDEGTGEIKQGYEGIKMEAKKEVSCEACKVEISKKVAAFSSERFGRLLCFECQKLEK